MDPVVTTAGTALVNAMTADAWQQIRKALVAWWRRVRPEQAGQVETDLDADRAQLLAARERHDEDTQRALEGAWQLRLDRLVAGDSSLTDQLRLLLENHIQPLLHADEQTQIGSIVMRAEARGNAQVNMAGRDQYITKS
jgi:hypothetical protein